MRKTRKFYKRGGGKCEELYNQCKREMPPSPPPRKHRSPKKEDIYEEYHSFKGTPYENATSESPKSRKHVVGKRFIFPGTTYAEETF